MGLYYHSTMESLLSIISEKDIHLKALQEKLSDFDGSYFPRKYKTALETFEPEKWREQQRKLASDAKETVWEMFKRWGTLDEEVWSDWESVVNGIGIMGSVQNDKDKVRYSEETCSLKKNQREQEEVVVFSQVDS
jgi:hypothetical protein